jgi:general secretion pathway protein D
LGGLGAFGALGGFGAQRQDVGTHIKVTPHINAVDQVRLEIQEEDSAPGAAQGALGAIPITQRRANTTIVADDQQTVVIGGLMRDTVTKSAHKIPVLGDLPVLGFLFRTTSSTKEKTNLLLILTPYIIRDQQDLRKVFERKMQERQEFLDRYFVFEGGWEPPKDYSRANGLIEDIRKSYAALEEQMRLEEESRPLDKGGHEPSAPIELPSGVKGGPPAGTPAGNAAPAAPAAPARPRAPVRRPRTDDSPIRINPIARSVPATDADPAEAR